MDYVKAFLIGGLICALVQILMEKTRMLPGRIMVLLVCLGVALGALGIYAPFLDFAGRGPACLCAVSATIYGWASRTPSTMKAFLGSLKVDSALVPLGSAPPFWPAFWRL